MNWKFQLTILETVLTVCFFAVGSLLWININEKAELGGALNASRLELQELRDSCQKDKNCCLSLARVDGLSVLHEELRRLGQVSQAQSLGAVEALVSVAEACKQ